jgi:hypothetical protein
MKTIKLNGSLESNMILRLPDATAQEIVNKGGGQYIPKSEWKALQKTEEPVKKPPAKSKRQRKKKESA